eukprot:scaffold61586_cov25-Tisochrysis_lutea.AAC.1
MGAQWWKSLDSFWQAWHAEWLKQMHEEQRKAAFGNDVVCAEEGRGMRTRGGVIEEAKHDSCKASEAEAALRVVHGLSHCLSLN